ncbi:hypothetical protein [Flagellimonas algicola]|uniref:Uncharacterized protein n=1 Tax=Flagellimonas algicola TaxID=2583815 RepID=A0ABY2WM61_9FLAO|nr:hypothetical protein [Allomuricauda algicola]TMU56070.1 hypothetical protein FGG15_00580 [Allomuricauda algicola]
MSEFDNVMSERSDFELFEILGHQKDSYKAEALAAAQRAFDSRNVTREQISEFEQRIQSALEQQNLKEKRNKELSKKAWDLGKLFLPTVKDTLDKTFLSLCIFLSLAYLYHLIQDLSLIIVFFSDLGDWDASVWEFLLPYVLFPIGIFGLWKRKKVGWFLISGLLSYYAFSTIYGGISAYRYNLNGNFGVLDSIFPKPNVASLLFRFAVLFGIVIFLSRKKALEIYKIGRTTALVVIIIICVLTTIRWWGML